MAIVYECFFWKQLLHKLFDRILASSILCTIIFWRKLSLSSFNNCFIGWLLWHNWKHGWCLAMKWIEITAHSFKKVFLILDDFVVVVHDLELALVIWSRIQSTAYIYEGLEGRSVVAVGSLYSHNPANPDLEKAPLGIEMPKWWAFMSSRSQVSECRKWQGYRS